SPVWSTNGDELVFSSGLARNLPSMLRKAANGGGTAEELLKGGSPTDWSPDGRLILYALRSKSKFELWTLSLSGERKAAPFLQFSSNQTSARFSPDGRWVAYTSDESGGVEDIYIRTFPASDRQGRISVGGGS